MNLNAARDLRGRDQQRISQRRPERLTAWEFKLIASSPRAPCRWRVLVSHSQSSADCRRHHLLLWCFLFFSRRRLQEGDASSSYQDGKRSHPHPTAVGRTFVSAEREGEGERESRERRRGGEGEGGKGGGVALLLVKCLSPTSNICGSICNES